MAKNKNIYKPRYKIAFQAKSKIWPYKNSRLRRFFTIRGRWPNRCGSFRKNILVASTIKWTVARRFIRPYSHRIYPQKNKSKYKAAFYIKQQLRHFYGKVTEAKLRRFYKTHLIDTVNRNKSFFGALECRADMFLFRLRLLPTIYACHQYVHHHGLVINKVGLEKSPHALVRIGDRISIPQNHWRTLYKYLLYRVFYRAYGKTILKKRQYTLLKKKCKWLYRWKKRLTKTIKKMKKKIKRKNYFLRRRNKYAILPIAKKTQFSFYKKTRKNFFKKEGFKLTKTHRKTKLYKKNWKEKDEFYNTSLYQIKLFQYKTIREVHMLWFHIYRSLLPNINTLLLLKNNTWTTSIINNLCTEIYISLVQFLQFFYSLKKKYARFWNNINTYLQLNKKIKSAKSNLYKHKQYLKRRPRILILILSFVYTINTQWTNVLEDYQYKFSKLSDYLKLKFIKKLKKQDIVFKIQTFSSYKSQLRMEEEAFLNNEVRLQEIKDKVALKKEHFTLIFRIWMRKLFRKIKPRKKFYAYQKKKEKRIAQGHNLLYFLISRRYKKLRKTTILRLKNVHWYIPNYIYFDLRTLQAILLYSPRSNEILFPFKCSLLKIFSFYKSIGV